MSGGSYDYIYMRIEQFANDLRTDTLDRYRFRNLLYRVAEAAHDIEWQDSGDGADEYTSIRACFEDNQGEVVMGYLKEIRDLINTYMESEK